MSIPVPYWGGKYNVTSLLLAGLSEGSDDLLFLSVQGELLDPLGDVGDPLTLTLTALVPIAFVVWGFAAAFPGFGFGARVGKNPLLALVLLTCSPV